MEVELAPPTLELHRRAPVFDAMMPWGNLDHLQSMWDAAEGGLGAAHVTVAHHPHPPQVALGRIEHYRRIVDANSSRLRLVRSVAEMRATIADGRVGVVFGFQDTAPIGYRLDLIALYARLGVRIVQLTYNDQNLVGSGCCDDWQGPLSRFGRRVLAELEANRIAVDVSHCGDRTTEDSIARASRPVLCTHSGARSVCDAYGRNKTDPQITAIAETGGVIGVPWAPFLLKREPDSHRVLPSSVDDVVRHIDHIASLVGWRHVGLGSDLCSAWVDAGHPPPESSFRWWRESCPHVFGAGPTDRYDPHPPDLRRHSQLFNLTGALLSRGWSSEQVRGVLGGNFLRVLETIWGG